jgi:hypothetical protein
MSVLPVHAVAQLLEALRYESEGRGLDSSTVSLEFFVDINLLAHYGHRINSASNRNER